jgi:hypothetical protein
VLDFAEAALEEQIAHRRRVDADGQELEFLSPIDLRLLATGYHFGYGVLTDDLALKLAVREFELAVVTSLQMLRYFFDLKFVDAPKVDTIMQQWHAGGEQVFLRARLGTLASQGVAAKASSVLDL